MKISFGSYLIVGHRPGKPAKKSTADAPQPDRTGQSLPTRARLSVANWLPLKIQRKKIPQSRENQQASQSEKEVRALQVEKAIDYINRGATLDVSGQASQSEKEVRALQVEEAIEYIKRGATLDVSRRAASLASRTPEVPTHQDDTTGAQTDAPLVAAKNKGKEPMVDESSGSSFHQQSRPISVRNNGEASMSRVPHRASTAEGPELPQMLPGEGWGMTFLRRAKQRALQEMAWDSEFAPDKLKQILSSHPDLEATDENGLTPLLAAVLSHNIDFIKILIEHGANVDASDINGDTALHMLARSNEQMMKPLLDAGANPGITNHCGETPLFHARSAVAIKHLLDHGSPINHCDLNGNSALMRMVLSKRYDQTIALLEHGTDLDIKNKSGLSFADLMAKAANVPLDVIPKNPLLAKAVIELLRREWHPRRPIHFPLEDRKPVRPNLASPAIQGGALEGGRPINRLPSVHGRAREVRRSINKLPSGQKINIVDRPDHTFEHLGESDAEAISEALGFGQLAKHSEERAQQLAAIRESFALFASEMCNGLYYYNNKVLSSRELFAPLSDAEFTELLKLIDITHMRISAKKGMNGDFKIPLQLRVFFSGTENWKDVRQDLRSAFGVIGSIDRAAKRTGELFAKLLAHSDVARLDFLSGLSMGGASAQTFRATIESRIQLPNQLPMILLDPQLLNNSQARRATKGGSFDVDYSKPRGVAITLDYDKERHRGLMGIMKGIGGYRYPGLVQIKLGLTDTDGWNNGRPETSGLPGLGYHADIYQYARALGRFSENRLHKILDDPALKDVRPLRWLKLEKPVRTSDLLIPIAQERRFPMPTIDEEDGGSEDRIP